MNILKELDELCSRPFLELNIPLSKEDALRMEGAELLASEVREVLNKYPHIITTVDELNELPIWTMILDADNDLMEKMQRSQRRRGKPPIVGDPFWSFVRCDEIRKGPVALPAIVIS